MVPKMLNPLTDYKNLSDKVNVGVTYLSTQITQGKDRHVTITRTQMSTRNKCILLRFDLPLSFLNYMFQLIKSSLSGYLKMRQTQLCTGI